MTLVITFIAITTALLVVNLVRRNFDRALAFLAVLCGLLIMLAIRGNAGGIHAFALWTLIAYFLLRFPVAAALYLLSAFCYILKLQGEFDYAIQVASNIAGLTGLVAIHYGRPRIKPVGENWPRAWRLMAMGGSRSGAGRHSVGQKSLADMATEKEGAQG